MSGPGDFNVNHMSWPGEEPGGGGVVQLQVRQTGSKIKESPRKNYIALFASKCNHHLLRPFLTPTHFFCDLCEVGF